MKIAICGTQCVGKSTFIKDFIEKYPEYSTPTESYRDVIVKHKLNLNQQADIKGQTIILNKLIDEVLTMGNENVILDRSIIDNLVYTSWAKEQKSSNITYDYLIDAFNYGIRFINQYDLIIHIPLVGDGSDPVIVDDNLRATDPQYRVEIDELFEDVLNDLVQLYNFPRERIIDVCGSREDRMNQISMIIDKYS